MTDQQFNVLIWHLRVLVVTTGLTAGFSCCTLSTDYPRN